MPCIDVQLQRAPYQVRIERGQISTIGGEIAKLGIRGKAGIITDSNVGPLYARSIEHSLNQAGIEHATLTVPAGEASKSVRQFGELCSELIRNSLDRSSFIIALGGGVVGDLAGFVAASYFRGIPFIQIPTTIVAQVDSAVGGKTGINAPEGKNLIGAFHQPKAVFTDPETLLTLADREFNEGFAEVIKHAAIREPSMFPRILEAAHQNRAELADLIADNVAIKARIVEEDEHETSGTRALLNFGHTLGHGIEASVPYGELLHGEAISLGMRAALDLSVRHAGLPIDQAHQVLHALDAFGLPLVLPKVIETSTVMAKTASDKKFTGGKIKFVLLQALGDAFVSSDLGHAELEAALERLRKSPF